MTIKPIKTEQDYADTLKKIESLMSAKPNTPQMDELEVLSTLVEVYEEQFHKIEAPDPIEAIKFRMEQDGLKQKDKNIIMAQITIYITNDLESKVKEIASSLDTSVSKYIATIIEKNINNNWNPKVKKLAGSWSDFPTIEEIRKESADDVKRETF